MLWMTGMALAGELYVASAVPVNVWVDGTYVPYAPGTMTAQVSGLQGVHMVQVAGADNVVRAEAQVQVPWNGALQVTYDGARLVVLAAAGLPAVAMPQVVVLPAAPAPTPAPEPKGPVAMSAGAFSSLVAAVEGGSFSDDKLAAIRAAAAKNWFTIEQVGRLVDAIDYGSDQVTAVQICAPKVVDPENAFSLGSHFTYSSDKEAALALFR